MRHEIPANHLVDHQNSFSHSMETVAAMRMGLLRISRSSLPRFFRVA